MSSFINNKIIIFTAFLILATGCKKTGPINTHFGTGITSTLSGLSYISSTVSTTKNVALAPDVPLLQKGVATHYSISPALPTGVSIDATNGVISGTPVVSLTQTTFTITATDGTNSTTTTVKIESLPASSTVSTLTATPLTVLANGVAVSTFTVTLRDKNGVPIKNETVRLNSTRGTTDTITPALAVTNSSGVATFTASSTTSGTPNFSATDMGDSIVLVQTATVTFNPGVATHLVLSGVVATSTAGAAFNITVTAKDANNNIATGYAGTVSISSTDLSATLPSSSTLTSGVGTFNITLKTAGNQNLTADDGTLSAVTSTNILVSPDVATYLSFTTEPSATGNTDTTLAQQPTIKIYDVYNNIVTSATDSISLTAYSDTSCATPIVGGISALSNPFVATSGVASFSNVKVLKTNAIRMGASATGLTDACSSALVISAGAPSALTSTINGAGPVVANGIATSTITITILDANSNAIELTTPTFSATNTGGSNSYSACSATDSSGLSTCTLSSTKAETKTLQLATPVSVTGGSVVFRSGAADHLTVTAHPSSVIAGASNSATLTTYDSNNNVVTDYTGTVSFASTDGAATLPSDYNFIVADGGIKSVSGFTLKTSGSQSLTATDTITNSITGTQSSITVSPAAVSAAHSSFILSASSGLADGATTVNATITLKDVYDNVLPNITVGISSDRGASDTLAANTTTNSMTGIATLTIKSSTTGLANISATDIDDTVSIGSALPLTFKKVSSLSNGSLAKHACAVVDNGAVNKPIYCWGNNTSGQLGLGTTSGYENSGAAATTGIFVATGTSHTCSINAIGDVYCWGDNTSGQLGTGNYTSLTSVGANVSGLPTPATSLSLGEDFSCALLSNHTIYCWGSNDSGKLGYGSAASDSTSAQLVSSLTHVTSVTAAYSHVCAIDNGLPYCWGKNDFGQLGIGIATTFSNIPALVALGGGGNALSIAASTNNTCAVRFPDHLVYCWGKNLYGETGDDSAINTVNDTPVITTAFSSSESALTLVAGSHHFCATVSESTTRIHCWGDNQFGQSGTNPLTSSTLLHPTIRNGFSASGISMLASLATSSCALLSSGLIQCFGDDTKNALNDGAAGNTYSPSTLSGLPF